VVLFGKLSGHVQIATQQELVENMFDSVFDPFFVGHFVDQRYAVVRFGVAGGRVELADSCLRRAVFRAMSSDLTM
jgi:hypothetical protein